MLTQNHQVGSEVGSQLLDSIEVTKEQLNILFAALLFTAIGVFLGANLLMFDPIVMQGTAPIALTCLAVLLIFYTISSLLRNLAWGLVITYALLWLAVYSHMQWLVIMLYVCAFFALIYTIRSLRFEVKEIGLVLLMALIATVVILGCEGSYTSFDMLQRLSAGNVFPDTLFHASIAAMIKNYSIVSTGLHGLIETPNHVLSHELIASISNLSGAGVFETYGVVPQVLFSPILIFSIVGCCLMLDTGRSNIPVIWALVCVLLVVVPFLFGKWGFWDSYFVSESYIVAVGLFPFALALLFKRDLSLFDFFLVVILAALLANAKSTVGIIYFGLWLLRSIFLCKHRLHLELLVVALVGVIVGVGVFQLVNSQASTQIVPLHFISAYSYRGGNIVKTMEYFFASGAIEWRWRSAIWAVVAIATFFIFHFSFSWIVVVRMVRKCGWNALIHAPGAVYSLGAIAAGTLIVVLFKLPGGAAYYFSNVAFFVSLPLVVLFGLNNYETALAKLKINSKRAQTFVLAAVLFLSILMGIKTLKHTYVTHRQDASQHSSFVDALIDLRRQVPIATYIELNSAEHLDKLIKQCWAQPFVYPAISERPWINVIVPRDECDYKYYGFAEYGLSPLQKNVSLPPKLLPGMSGLSWP